MYFVALKYMYMLGPRKKYQCVPITCPKNLGLVGRDLFLEALHVGIHSNWRLIIIHAIHRSTRRTT